MAKELGWIEVFKSGTVTDSAGNTKIYTDEDLQTIADKYNESIKDNDNNDVPFVRGHPTTDSPAVGWVEKLKVVTDTLLAKPKEMIDDFVEQVKNKEYKKISIALKPELVLRHIGFLGAIAPAVSGMESVEFAEGEYVEYDMDVEHQEPGETIAQAEVARQARAKASGIGVKDKIGYAKKPDGYTDIDESMFADATNFLYPIDTKANLQSSMKFFDSWGGNYSDVERQVIGSKFFAAAESFGIADADISFYSEMIAKDMNTYSEFIEVLTKPDVIITTKDGSKSSGWDKHYNDISNKAFEKAVGELLGNEGSEFAITLRPEMKKTPTGIFAEYTSANYADPVHRRFAIKTKSDCRAAMSVFSRESIYSKYEQKEQQEIVARIVTACSKHGINRTPTKWTFTEGADKPNQEVSVPVSELSNKQLINFINNKLSKTNDGFTNNQEGSTMNELLAFLVGWMTENISEEAATSLQAAGDEWIAANAPAEGTPPAEEAAEISDEMKAMQEKVTALETKNRQFSINTYLNSRGIIEKVPPAMQEEAKQIFEVMVSNQKGQYSDEDQGDSVKLFKTFIGKLPDQFSTDATPDGNPPDKKKQISSEYANSSPESQELHLAVEEYRDNKDNFVDGKRIEYAEALYIVEQEIKEQS